MGSLTIEIPLQINRTFRVEDTQDAEKLLSELENVHKKRVWRRSRHLGWARRKGR